MTVIKIIVINLCLYQNVKMLYSKLVKLKLEVIIVMDKHATMIWIVLVGFVKINNVNKRKFNIL
jgi:hypothetical protein